MGRPGVQLFTWVILWIGLLQERQKEGGGRDLDHQSILLYQIVVKKNVSYQS